MGCVLGLIFAGAGAVVFGYGLAVLTFAPKLDAAGLADGYVIVGAIAVILGLALVSLRGRRPNVR